MRTAAEIYSAQIDAMDAQIARLHGGPQNCDSWGGEGAKRFRYDPRRELDANLEKIASFLHPRDTLIDAEGCKAFLPGITQGWETLEQVALEEGLV